MAVLLFMLVSNDDSIALFVCRHITSDCLGLPGRLVM